MSTLSILTTKGSVGGGGAAEDSVLEDPLIVTSSPSVVEIPSLCQTEFRHQGTIPSRRPEGAGESQQHRTQPALAPAPGNINSGAGPPAK